MYTLDADIREKWEYSGTVHQLFIDFKEVYDSVRKGTLHHIPIECGIFMKQIRLNNMCLN
jgi:hypothetical protein